MSGHTPGPWAVTTAKPRKVTAGGVLICTAVLRNSATTSQNKHGKGEDEAKANARLIAAAPELLVPLQFAVNHLNTDTFIGDAIDEFHTMAAAAIAKATKP